MQKANKNQDVFKENGAKQRDGVNLSLPIVNALVQTVLSGRTLYPKGGLEVGIPEGEHGIKNLKISRGTLNSWITRGNVIPETGQPLKAILDKARKDYRINNLLERGQEAVDEAEDLLKRVLNVRTKVPLRTIKGEVVKDKNGSVVYREDPALIKTQLKAAMYITERLDPEHYGRPIKRA